MIKPKVLDQMIFASKTDPIQTANTPNPKNFLNMQHIMHPEISLFSNSFFYFNKIQDAPNVQRNNYRKQYLPQPMLCPYSFINVIGGREQFDNAGRSYKNMAEVAVVITILKNQTRHCFTRYIEYHRCVAAKGEGAPECDKFAKQKLNIGNLFALIIYLEK